MGRRTNRRKPTRKEKVGDQRPGVGRSEDQKPVPARKREMSPETRELVAAYARVMGWAPDQVLPQHNEVNA